MESLIEQLRKYKEQQEKTLEEGEKILDISFYGKINLSKNDENLKNESQEEIYLVKKEVNNKIQLEFKSNNGTIATIGEDGQIAITPEYKELINENELLIQLQKVMPVSLEKLEKMQEKDHNIKENGIEAVSREDKQETTKYVPNPKDIQINMKDKKIEVETEIIDVPDTNVSDDYLLDIILLALAGTGIALIVYAKKKQKK